jgi:hypothetical chaperone protein
MAQKVACGIDFGTSNSTVAISLNGDKRLIALEDGKTTLPSAIFFKPQAAPLFGSKAISSYMDGEEGRFMRGLKKILGTQLMDDNTRIGSRSVPFTEILGTFISHLKDKAEQAADHEIENIVLGRPVHFHDNDPEADRKSQETLKKIAGLAGFKNIEFLFEPIAAAFAHEAAISDEKLSLVVDLGGGTSDFTIIKISQDKMNKSDRKDDILSTSGVRIGGTTFDYRLSLKKFMPRLGMGTQYRDLFEKEKLHPVPTGVYFQLSDWAMVNFAQTKKAIAETMDIKRRALAPDKIDRLIKLQQNHLGHSLLAQVEAAKISLTHAHDHDVRFKEFSDEFDFSITRKNFEDCISYDVERIFQSISECIAAAGITKDEIDLIILTGGSTELPMIHELIAQTFPHAAISQGNKMDSVGLGLAYRAGNIF